MIPLNAPELERAIRGSLGFDLRLAVAARPLPAGRLSIRERSRAALFATAARRIEWLTGRAALKRLLSELGRKADTAEMAFPNAGCSLTHSGGIAVAAGASGWIPRGIGIDLEFDRPVSSLEARFFLRAEEWSRIRRSESIAEELLRLWTVKEALYKADLDNEKRVLADYLLPDPSRCHGRAALAPGGSAQFRYASFRVPGGYFSIAVRT